MTNLTSEQYRDVFNHVEGTETVPTVQHLLRKAVVTFFSNFGAYPEFAGAGPGKVQIFGDPAEYPDGSALSLATPLATIIVGRRSLGSRFVVVTSADVGKPHKVSFSFSKNRPLSPGCPFWLNYVKGIIDNYNGGNVQPFEAAIESSIPIGVNLGSSSALEVATYSFLEILEGEKSDFVNKAKACQEVDKNFALKEVGLVDKMTAISARDRHLMLIDLQTNQILELPFKDKSIAFVVMELHFPNLKDGYEFSREKQYLDVARQILNVDTLKNCKEDDVDKLKELVEEILNEKTEENEDVQNIKIEENNSENYKNSFSEETEVNDENISIRKKNKEYPFLDNTVVMEKLRFFINESRTVKEAVKAWKMKNYYSFGEKMKESDKAFAESGTFNLMTDLLTQISNEVQGVVGVRRTELSLDGQCIITLIKRKYISDYCKYIINKFEEKKEQFNFLCALYLTFIEIVMKIYEKERKINFSNSESSTMSFEKNDKRQRCLKKMISSYNCYPKEEYCQKYENYKNYLKKFARPCTELMSDPCDKNLFYRQQFYDIIKLNLQKNLQPCAGMKDKRCATWSRLPEIFVSKTKLSKKKKKIQKRKVEENDKSNGKEESLKGEKSSEEDSENTREEEMSNKDSETKSLEQNSSQNGSENTLALIEEYEKKKISVKNYMETLEEMTHQGEGNLVNPKFYVISPFAGARMICVTKNDILRSLYAKPVPHPKALLQSALKVFKAHYRNKATAIGIAPATLTLFGEFMEFQLGYIICMALTMVTVMIGGKNDSVNFSVKTTSKLVEYPTEMMYPIPCVRPLELESRNWANFILGTVSEFKGHVPGFNAVINSSVPIEMGVNSCSALQACTFTFLENLTGHCNSDPFDKADLCGKSEFEFHPQPSELVTRCSSVKFFPTFLCKEGHLMFINCKRYKISQYFFDHPSYVFLIASCKKITTNVTIESLDERLKRCVRALEILGRNSLLSIDSKHLKCLERKEASEETIKRVKYVVSEHERTIEAITAIKNEDYARVGLLMNQSHASLRDDYEVSCPEIETIIKLAGEVEGVLGAKMLGKGLTATVILLVNIFDADNCIRHIRKNYRPKNNRPDFYITKPSRGAFSMSPDRDLFNIP